MKTEPEQLHELALFAGAGGGILGGHLLGWRTICAVERDAYAASVLVARQNDGILPPFPIWDDVCTFDGRPWRGRVDVISGGFPCQDISPAGKGAGIEGERSGLWREMARIVGEVLPRFVFVENSRMLVGRGLAVVLGDLAAMGYDARWGIVGADDAGAPHERKRVWIVADASGGRFGEPPQREVEQSGRAETVGSGEIVANAYGCGGIEDSGSRELRPNRFEQSPANQGNGCAPKVGQKWWIKDPADISNADEVRLQGCGKKQDTGDSRLQVESLRSNRERSETRGTATAESYVGRVANGVAARMDRLKAIGNGQVPAVAKLAWDLLS